MAIVANVVTLGCLWIAAFMLLGGGEQTSSPDAAAPAPEKTAVESSGEDSTSNLPEQDPEAGEDFAASAPEEPDAVEVDRANPRQQTQSANRPNNNVPDKAVDYDPLGTGAEQSTLTETEKGRVQLAGEQFVIHAYGFTGKGEDGQFKYEGGVSRYVGAATFYDSPGAEPLAELSKKIGSGGITSTASLESFSIGAVKPGSVDGTATFTVESPDGSVTYSQKLKLTKTGSLWRVGAAQQINEETR
jgi:hypothetical protein